VLVAGHGFASPPPARVFLPALPGHRLTNDSEIHGGREVRYGSTASVP